jgi:tRNA (adenine22-N1)-methyltransferase
MVTTGYKIADIGTDHGFVPISLVERKIIHSAIAMDVNDGPLEIAQKNIKNSGLSDVIKVRKSDGFESLSPSEVDCAILAGMGGHLIIKILSENWEVTRSLKECILQPQSEWEMVRGFLIEHGLRIIKEEMVKDSGKYYLIMKVTASHREEWLTENVSHQINYNEKCQGKSNVFLTNQNGKGQPDKTDINKRESNKWSKVELAYGKLLLESKNPILKEYLIKEINIKEKILEQLVKEDGEHIAWRRREVVEEIGLLNQGLERVE